jgi:hypothetical protein
MKLYIYLIILFVGIFDTLVAQNIPQIKGKVQDKKTGEALSFANIYISNTTIGTQTNENGEFVLKVPSLPNLKLIVSYVGYQSLEKVIEDGYNLIELVSDDKLLNEIKVSSRKDDKWNNLYKDFEKVFLGNSEAAKMCKILRPWEVDLEKFNQKLTAHAALPIEIENRYLGYKVFWYLNTFESSPMSFSMLGNSRFELLSPKDDKEALRWKQNREEAYKGSLTHFLASLYRGTSKAEGFRIFQENILFKGKNRQANFGVELSVKKSVREISLDSIVKCQNKLCYLNLQNQIEVHFTGKIENQPLYNDIPYQVSWLEGKEKILAFNAFGILEKPSNIEMSGSMSATRISELLPIDYQLIAEQQPIIQQKLWQEKVWLQTQKAFYHPQERIWIKASMIYENPLYQDSLSKVLYVDLISPKNKILMSQIWAVYNGEANGDMLLSDSLETGIYYLRAYTQWMRNFGDSTFFYKKLPILSKHERVLFKKSENLSDEQLTIKLNKEQVVVGDSIELTINGLPFQSYSIAVLHEKSTGIIDVPLYTFNEKSIFKATFPAEKSLLVQGTTKDKNNKLCFSNLSVVNVKNKNLSILETDTNGKFSIENQWAEDSLKLLIKATDTKGRKLRTINIIERNIPPIKIPILPEITILNNSENVFVDNEYQKIDNSILLNTVSVKARKEENERWDRSYKIYGKADYVVNATEIQDKVSDENLITFLQGRVPGVKIDVRLDEKLLGKRHYRVRIRGRAGFTESPTETGVSTTYEPLVLIDGIPFPDIEQLETMSVSQIDRIEVINRIEPIFGARGSNGIIAIYTKSLAKNTLASFDTSSYPNFQQVSIPAFSITNIFTQNPKQQSTIYWNPSVFSDKTGKMTLKFSVGSLAQNRIIQVVGIDVKGKIRVAQTKFSVEELIEK